MRLAMELGLILLAVIVGCAIQRALGGEPLSAFDAFYVAALLRILQHQINARADGGGR